MDILDQIRRRRLTVAPDGDGWIAGEFEAVAEALGADPAGRGESGNYAWDSTLDGAVEKFVRMLGDKGQESAERAP
jgi:hypothetical protein